MFQGKWYDEVEIGASFGARLTVTETHLVLGSGLFGTRILHGPFAGALVSAPVEPVFPAPGAAQQQAHQPRASSRLRNSLRCTLPVVVMGSASINSISFGVS
jgi:hypothetical protein